MKGRLLAVVVFLLSLGDGKFLVSFFFGEKSGIRCGLPTKHGTGTS